MAKYLVLTAFVLSIGGQILEGTPPPAIGDIQLRLYENNPALQGYYEVLVYYTDGIEEPSWGGICFTVTAAEAGVICRQLGYEATNVRFESGTSQTPVWLKEVTCDDEDAQHILRCQYSVASGLERRGGIPCSTRHEVLLVSCDNKQLIPYDGEARLCPPDQETSPNIRSSVSYGIPALYFTDYGVWRGIIQTQNNAFLRNTVANTICRQMGFTGAISGSAIARNASNYTFDDCYRPNNGRFSLKRNAWMRTTELSCGNGPGDGPQKCLGCCYNYPMTGGGCDNCDGPTDIVLGCSFDLAFTVTMDERTPGSQADCELNGGKAVNSCERKCSRQEKKIRDLQGGLGFFVAFLSLVVIGLVVFIIVACKVANK